jgi:hypothetical protein
MSSRKARSKESALGRAQFILRAEDEALEVRLDRLGFRRLLRTLEILAKDGGKQEFRQSGRQRRGRNGGAFEDFSPTKLTFHIEESEASKNPN